MSKKNLFGLMLVASILLVSGCVGQFPASIGGSGTTTEVAEIPCSSVNECTTDFPIPAEEIDCRVIDGVNRCFTMQTITR